MPKRSPSQHVPKDMQTRFDEITKLTDAFCQTYLNDEYGHLCRELTATLYRKRPSPLTTQIPTQVPPSPPPAVPARNPVAFPAGLTAREVEVLRLIAQGWTDAQIAEALVISPRTVNHHTTSLYSKLNVASRAAATRFAIEHNLL